MLNLLWRRTQLEGAVRRQPQHRQSQQHQRQKSQSVHSPRDHDFLGQLEGRKSWWDAVAKNAFVSETGRGHKLKFSAWPPVSFPVRPLPQRLRKEKTQTLYSLKGRWNQWGTSTEACSPICSWSINRTGVQICHQLKEPELVYKETNFHDDNVERRFSEHQEWTATIHLKDAYLHVPIARVTEGSSGSGGKAEIFSSIGSHWVLLLGPSWRHSLPVVAICRAKGIRLIAYLDDFLVLARNWKQSISHTSIVFLDQAGFRRISSQFFCRLGSLSNPPLSTAQTFLGSCELGSNTSSCPSGTGEKRDRIHCFCTEQRGQRVGKMVGWGWT